MFWGAILQEVKIGMQFQRKEALDNEVMQPIAFISKSSTSMDTYYSNFKREILGILYIIETFHHYCFACEVSMITDHKPLVVIFKKDVASLSHRLQRIP